MSFRALAAVLKESCPHSHSLGKSLRVATVGLVLAGSVLRAQVAAPATSGTSAPISCGSIALDFDGTSDIQGIKEYKQVITDLLERSDFDTLDCIADAARSTKARFPGGLWKLHSIYSSLDEPEGHFTDEDWNTRLLLLKRWTATKPNSVTARVALAGAYTSYAWDARGTGTSDSVTDNGWRLFNERLEKAEAILDEDSVLSENCPESFLVRQQIAQGQGMEKETALVKRAISLHPDYYYYYRIHATLVLPKWYGE